MNAEIIVAIIGFVEAIICGVLPFIITKLGEKKSATLTKQKLLPQYSKPIGVDSIENDINQIYEQTMEPFNTEKGTSIYLREYSATIEIVVDENEAQIASAYTLNFVNPYREDYIFKRKPKLRKGLEFDTYSWKNVRYQGQPAEKYIMLYPEHQQQTNSETSLYKSGLEIPLTKEHHESVLHFGANYCVEGARFFNAYYFWHYCKTLNIDVRLTGPNADQYEIRWAVALSSNRKNTRVERSVHCDEPHHVSFTASGWIFPSDGYVITINKIA